ncbi:hypothetical protein [Burkholderia vietnamiensis]|uniref:hypothetical protein n=1 Tax=Burkholderia vietnamiensis TaxID=60552 RepID=UPI00075EADED|nr:hypothetical protein [Burkholderia vietnamiensis]KVR95826.1 metal-dependent phosphohydrolase [Burkholderia vietnamiensis]
MLDRHQLKVTPNILTASGRYFDFLQPKERDICISDIATALSRICRFTGHTSSFYSVAQHSVIVSRIVPPEFAMQGLLHDAAEAYLGDVSTPLKQLIPDYKAIEHRVEQVICNAFFLPFPLDPCVKKADLRMLVTEKRDLMPRPLKRDGDRDGVAWVPFADIHPLEERITPVSSSVAKRMFLERYEELTED